MTDQLPPELEAFYADGAKRMKQISPILNGAHSFVMMTILAQLVARWLASHPEHMHEQLVGALATTVEDDLAYILYNGEAETRH
jgi:hypothetical protein